MSANCQCNFHFMTENSNKNRMESHQPLVFGQSVGGDRILICVAFEHRFDMVAQLIDIGVSKEKIGFLEEYHKCYSYYVKVIDRNLIRIKKNNVIMDCHNSIELMIAVEILVGNTYNYNYNKEYCVIDIGMNIGAASLYFANQNNVTFVYGFEPEKYVYNRAISNFALNPIIENKLHPFNIVLGKVDGGEKYFCNVSDDCSVGIKKVEDISEKDLSNSLSIEEIEVKKASKYLENILKKHQESVLLKMDCEGTEYGILEDLIESGVIKRIDIIIMEWHGMMDNVNILKSY